MDRKETEIGAGERPDGVSVGAEGIGVQDAEAAPARFRALLRRGEELYGTGRFEAAIHVWTRVLFLDRGNPEARRGIELAKQALSERHRGLDADVAEASRVFAEGDIEAARERVRSVLEIDPRHTEARQLEARIATAERRAPPQLESESSPAKSPETRTQSGVLLRLSRPRRPRPTARRGGSALQMGLFVAAAVLVFALGGFFLKANWERIVGDAAMATSGALRPLPALARTPETVPGLDELYYFNGGRLFAKERYREAREELARVAPASPVADEARNLILRIEERLLRGASGTKEPEESEGALP